MTFLIEILFVLPLFYILIRPHLSHMKEHFSRISFLISTTDLFNIWFLSATCLFLFILELSSRCSFVSWSYSWVIIIRPPSLCFIFKRANIIYLLHHSLSTYRLRQIPILCPVGGCIIWLGLKNREVIFVPMVQFQSWKKKLDSNPSSLYSSLSLLLLLVADQFDNCINELLMCIWCCHSAQL